MINSYYQNFTNTPKIGMFGFKTRNLSSKVMHQTPAIIKFRNFVLDISSRKEIISTAETCENCAKCGKGFKIGTNEAYNIKIKIRLWGISKIFCFCSHANMVASDEGISLKRKFLKKFLLNFTN